MRSLKDYLLNANYELDWLERPEGHSWGLWRATIDRMLIYFFPGGSSDVITEDFVPKDFILYQNYPNPFNPSTVISYQLPVSGDVTLKIYDILGNEITTLVDEYKPAGMCEIEFNSFSGDGKLVSGIYFYQLQSGNYLETKKMILLK
jgi:enterochelin esterase family protein